MQQRPCQDPGDDDPEARRHVVAHREGVVRRLLNAGLSVRLLRALLPEWCHLIERVADRTREPSAAEAGV